MTRDRIAGLLQARTVLVMMAAAMVCGIPGELLGSQAERRPSESSSSSARIERGVELASKGQCTEALAILRKSIPERGDEQLRYRAAMASAQCGMSVDQADVVVESLLLLNREFPADAKVLYITSRYYSELANRAARKLLEKAPSSAEAQAFTAEAYQARGDFESATLKYRKILEQYPKQPGVHYQLGQIILAKIPTATEEAKKEFEAEIEVNPTSPAAEYMLGDLAWREMKIDEAIPHFSRATELDVTLARPYLGLGLALNAAGRFREAIDPLKKYVWLTPADPAGHYQLAIAYSRIGNKQEAERQRALQLEAEEKLKPGSASTRDAPPN
jgi:tetratricopeptide (TPR) repeat protein